MNNIGLGFPKWFKIVLLVNGAVCIFYGIRDLFFTELSLIEADFPYKDTFYIQTHGITGLIVGVFSFYALKVNNWKKMKVYIEFGIVWLSLITLVFIYGAVTLPLSDTAIQGLTIDIVGYSVFDALYICLYIQKIRMKT